MATDEYPDDLAESNYYDEVLGPPPEPDQINDLPPGGRWIGVDKAVVEIHLAPSNRRQAQYSDFADYDSRSDEDLESNDADA